MLWPKIITLAGSVCGAAVTTSLLIFLCTSLSLSLSLFHHPLCDEEERGVPIGGGALTDSEGGRGEIQN